MIAASEKKTTDIKKYHREYQKRRYNNEEEYRLKKKQGLQNRIARIANEMAQVIIDEKLKLLEK